MDNTRMSRINRLIQKEISDLFRQQTQSLPGTLITVTSVTVSPGHRPCTSEHLPV